MTAQDPTAPASWPADDQRDAGTILREAREAAGLTLDAVSQQLKLAPRQVKAIEDSDFSLLPGRTFVRGFARNYARLLQLDPDAIVNALPGTARGSGLEAPPLNPTAVTMGELPSAAKVRPGLARWIIALVVAVIVIAATAYAVLQGKLDRKSIALPATEAPAAPSPAPSPALAPAVTVPAAPTSAANGTTVLPNSGISAPLDAGDTPPAGATVPAAVPPASAFATEPPRASEAPATAPIAFTVRKPSWIEVRDASGRPVLQQTVQPGQSPAITGSAPFEITIGNAPDVTLTYRGEAVDLGPLTRGGVARFTLK